MNLNANFYELYEDFKLPMTLKIHVIVDHYADYFKETGIFFKSTNDERHEGIHHSSRIYIRYCHELRVTEGL